MAKMACLEGSPTTQTSGASGLGEGSGSGANASPGKFGNLHFHIADMQSTYSEPRTYFARREMNKRGGIRLFVERQFRAKGLNRCLERGTGWQIGSWAVRRPCGPPPPAGTDLSWAPLQLMGVGNSLTAAPNKLIIVLAPGGGQKQRAAKLVDANRCVAWLLGAAPRASLTTTATGGSTDRCSSTFARRDRDVLGR